MDLARGVGEEGALLVHSLSLTLLFSASAVQGALQVRNAQTALAAARVAAAAARHHRGVVRDPAAAALRPEPEQ